jgi:hypothetical protein
MKKMILTSIICLPFLFAKAQLANTKWKTTLQLENPTEVIFAFRMDTVEAVRADNNESIETMHYNLTDTLLTLQKLFGQSDCDNSIVAKYGITKKDNGIYLTLVDDSCPDRSGVLDKTLWIKQQ